MVNISRQINAHNALKDVPFVTIRISVLNVNKDLILMQMYAKRVVLIP